MSSTGHVSHKGTYKVSKLGIGAPPIGSEANELRRREIRQIHAWPKGVHFEDAENIEPSFVQPLTPKTRSDSSYVGNSSLESVQSFFAKV